MKVNAIQSTQYVQNQNSNKAAKPNFKGLEFSSGVMDLFAKEISEGAISIGRTQEIMPKLEDMKFNMIAEMQRWGETRNNLHGRFPEFLDKLSTECKKNGVNPEDVDLVLKKGEYDRRGKLVRTYYDHCPDKILYDWSEPEFGGYVFGLEYAKPISPILKKVGLRESGVASMNKIPYEDFFASEHYVFNHEVPEGLETTAPLRADCTKLGTAESLLKNKESIENGANNAFDRIANLMNHELYWWFNTGRVK